MDNGRFALAYNPTDSMARHPLSIATSSNGLEFSKLLNIHSEVPPKRFWGREKRPGPQYVRGIVEGNGNPPGDALWIVYSVNKEDIWISRVPVPVKGAVNGPVADDFDQMKMGGVVKDWNIYSPRWCPVAISRSPDGPEKVLAIKDYDPYDYAKAVRVFQKSDRQSIRFQLYVAAKPGILAMEIVAANGARCVQMLRDEFGMLMVKNGDQPLSRVSAVPVGKWVEVQIDIDAPSQSTSIRIDGNRVARDYRFSAEGRPERFVFRTGAYRLQDEVQEYKSGNGFIPGWDEPGADEKSPEVTYYIRDFRVSNE
jgi:hypothetical protein